MDMSRLMCCTVRLQGQANKWVRQMEAPNHLQVRRQKKQGRQGPEGTQRVCVHVWCVPNL